MLFGVLAALLVLKSLVAANTGLAKDEGYYTLWSLYPSSGYLDHPPLVAVFIALGRWIAGDNPFGVRLLAVVSSIVVTAAIYRTGRLLFGPAAATLACLWFNLNPAAGLGFVITPDVPSVVFWTLAVWALAEFAHSRNPYWWLAVGVAAGLGLEGKYTNLFLGLGLLIYVLAGHERRKWLLLWQLWAGAALAMLLFLPNVVWNAQHNWATFAFQGRRIGDVVTEGNLLELLAAQALFLGPPLLLFTLVGAAYFLRRPFLSDRQGLALPLLTSMPLWLYLTYHAIGARVEANWVLPIWPMLSLVGAWAALHLWRAGAAELAAGIGRVAQGVYGAAALLLVYAQLMFQPFDLPTVDRTRELRGWTQLQAELSRLARESGAGSIVTVNDYGLTGQLVAYGLFARDPLPVRPLGEERRYAFLPPSWPESSMQPAAYVTLAPSGGAQDMPAGLFEEAVLIGVLDRRHGDDLIEQYGVYRVTLAEAAP